MCLLATLRFRCGHNMMSRPSCRQDNPGICEKPQRQVMAIYESIICPCMDCHNKRWDALDERRLSEIDDHQAHLAELTIMQSYPDETRVLLAHDLAMEDSRAEDRAFEARLEAQQRIDHIRTFFHWHATTLSQLYEGWWRTPEVYHNMEWLILNRPMNLAVRLSNHLRQLWTMACKFHGNRKTLNGTSTATKPCWRQFSDYECAEIREAQDPHELGMVINDILQRRSQQRKVIDAAVVVPDYIHRGLVAPDEHLFQLPPPHAGKPSAEGIPYPEILRSAVVRRAPGAGHEELAVVDVSGNVEKDMQDCRVIFKKPSGGRAVKLISKPPSGYDSFKTDRMEQAA